MINDVSGLADPKMLKVILESDCQYVLMHNLSIPANSKVILPEDEDPMTSVLNWMRGKLEILDQAGITRRRITVDPGIGFGKTALQSLALLKGAERLSELGCGVLIGHSRKSFLQGATTRAAEERDIETLGVSFSMLSKKVDILRVHNPMMHHRAMLAWGHTQ